MTELIPWAANPSDEHHRRALATLVETSLHDAELGEAVAGLPWVADGVQSEEADLLGHLKRFVQRPDLAPHRDNGEQWPWYVRNSPGNPAFDVMIADPRRLYVEMLVLFIGATHHSPRAAAALRPAMLDLAPIVDRLLDDPPMAHALLTITFHSGARTAAALVTFANEQEGGEIIILSRLTEFIPWAADSPDEHHRSALTDIIGTWLVDAELGEAVAGLPWVADGVQSEEAELLLYLRRIAVHRSALMAVALATLASEQEGDLMYHLLSSWRSLSEKHPGIAIAMADLPWVADGLTNEEAAYLVALAAAQDRHTRGVNYYNRLLRDHFVQSKTFSLPLAGNVTAWVFQDAPFPSGEDVPAAIEETARIIEEFTRAPFPTTDVILLTSSECCLEEGYAGHSMVLNRNPAGEVREIPHETGHYYFDFGTKWLVEGGAELVRAYVEDRKGVRSLDEARIEASNKALRNCSKGYGIENILHYTYHDNFFPYACAYPIGEAFLLSLVDAIGEEPVAAGLRELRSLGSDARWKGSLAFEKLIYDTLLKHVPPDKQADFLDVYDRLHGGPELPDIPDDHGDSAAGATAAAVGERLTGRLDYRFDLDFFRFQAEEGRSYMIRVNHSALPRSAIWIYSPEGNDLGRRDSDEHWPSGANPNGLLILWTAPSSGDYYAAVENFAGEYGAYTLIIDQLIPDDHGNSTATATAATVGEPVTGNLDYQLDLDFFRFQAEEGRSYRIGVNHGALRPYYIRIFAPEGHYVHVPRNGTDSNGPWMLWTAPASGDYYVVVDNGAGEHGAYTLTIAQLD